MLIDRIHYLQAMAVAGGLRNLVLKLRSAETDATLLFVAIAVRILLTRRFLFQLPQFSSRLRIFLANEAIDLRCVARGSPLEAGE